jgi:hypothetical protein
MSIVDVYIILVQVKCGVLDRQVSICNSGMFLQLCYRVSYFIDVWIGCCRDFCIAVCRDWWISHLQVMKIFCCMVRKKFRFCSYFFVFVLKGTYEHSAPSTKYFTFESCDITLKISDLVSVCWNCLKYIIWTITQGGCSCCQVWSRIEGDEHVFIRIQS